MRRILLTTLLIAGLGLASGQDGWKHSLGPVFPEPLDFVMLPWSEPAEPSEMVDCWRDQHVPYIGSEYQFYCYALPGVQASVALSELPLALREAGFSSHHGMPGDWFGPLRGTIGPMFGSDLGLRAWVFDWEDTPTMISFALIEPLEVQNQ